MRKSEFLFLPNGKKHEVVMPKKPVTPKENKIQFPDKTEVRVDWRKTFGVVNQVKELMADHEVSQEKATVNVPLDNKELPALVWFASDMHIGGMGTDHELLQEHIESVVNTNNAYAFFVGDDIDNGIWGSMVFEQAVPPYAQSFAVKDLAQELGGRNHRKKNIVLGRVTGNHTDWEHATSGHSWEGIWYGETKAPVFPGMGELTINVGSQTYVIGSAHRHWGASKLNPTNSAKRLMEHEYPNCDVSVVGHDHINEILKFRRGGKNRIAIRPGTYKTKDYWARKHGIGLGGQAGGCCVLFYPDKKKMLPFDRLEDGVEYLETLSKAKGF